MSLLKDEFFAETGIWWENDQGEPDIDYVIWLEAEVEKFKTTNSESNVCKYISTCKQERGEWCTKGNCATYRV